ncbi:MAG: hypothetical protein IJW79_09955 [Clostridia bacterium]|nr:hypothetical protein [Clostridia bacterium]
MKLKTSFKKAFVLILALITLIVPMGICASATESTVEPIDILSDYCLSTKYKSSDGKIGIPVGICTYAKDIPENTDAIDTQVIFYVINYNDLGENLSNEDYIPIIYDLLDQGYLVVTLDYFDNPKACLPLLTESIQSIRTDDTTLAAMLKDSNGTAYSYNLNKKRVMMEGYRMAGDILFYDLTGNAPKGVKESTVKSGWNSSGFESVYNKLRDAQIEANGSSELPEYKEMTSYEELYKPDLTPIDSRMWLDVFYPSRPTDDVSVLCWASSSQTRSTNHSDNAKRPHDVESVARGYAFAIYDHCYYPMARDDHYGYFNPYGIQSQVGIHTHAAAIRCVRYHSHLYGYGTDNYGGFGHSKSALIGSLANPHPELLPEQSHFGSYSYYRNEEFGDQPYLVYKDSVESIPSNLQFCYSSMGLGVELHAKNHNASTAPMFTASGISDEYTQWEFWSEQLNTFNQSGSNYTGLSFLDKGHEYVYGTNALYGFNELVLAFDYIDYFLKDNISPRVGYFTTDGLAEVTTAGGVSVQFTGSISEASIYNGVTLTDTTEGKDIPFKATATGNGSKWTFYAKDGFVEGHSYILNIGETVSGANGMAIQSAESAEFTCTNVPKVVACSAELFKNSISYYSTVAFQFSAPIDSTSLKQNTTVLAKITTKTTDESGNTETTVVEEYIKPVFEVVGDNTLWTIASSSHSKNKWGDSATTNDGTNEVKVTYQYTITIGANTCTTDGATLGEDYVVTFTTK